MSSVGRPSVSLSHAADSASSPPPRASYVQEEEGEADSDDESAVAPASVGKHAQASKPPASIMLQPMIKCGWLDTLSDAQQWTQMWFVLRGTVLAHYKDSDAALRGAALGNVSLSEAVVVNEPHTVEIDRDPRESTQRTFGLCITRTDALMALRAAGIKERAAWIAALEKAKAGAESAATPSAGPAAVAATAAASARWHHDELCYGCRAEFTLTRRRHHCRRCNHSHCNQCSKRRARIPDSARPDQLVRVCDDCYSILSVGGASAAAGPASTPAPSIARSKQARDEENGVSAGNSANAAAESPLARRDSPPATAAAPKVVLEGEAQPAAVVAHKTRATRPRPPSGQRASPPPASSNQQGHATISPGRSHAGKTGPSVGDSYVALEDEIRAGGSGTGPRVPPHGGRLRRRGGRGGRRGSGSVSAPDSSDEDDDEDGSRRRANKGLCSCFC